MSELTEKVVKGLAYCTQPIKDDEEYDYICPHDSCPYFREYKAGKCIGALCRDALTLLKAQQPRVMTLEEVKALAEDDLVWYEHVGINRLRPRVICYTDNSEIVFTDGGKWYFELDGYGKRWRCWTARPTPEQREAMKWNE